MTKRGSAGFTIIELVVTMAFMGIVIVSLNELYTGLRQTNRTANNYTIALQVAQQLVEKYRNTPYNNIAVGTTDASSSLAPYPSLLTPRSATTTVAVVDATGLKQVDVAVSYKDRTGIKNVQLRTLISYKGINR
jgi:type II secretory pathway pseudopilin PulG